MTVMLYGLMLVFHAMGWCLYLLQKKGSMENGRTFFSMIRAVLKRVWSQLPKREWLLEKVAEQRNRLKQPELELEIYKGSVLLKNLVLAEKNRPFSSDYLMERLMEHSLRLRPAYGRMLTLYRSGMDTEAFSVLESFCRSRAAKNFSLVLSKLDQIAPDELISQISVFQEMMEQQRITGEMKIVQRNSMIVTVLAVGTMFVMMIDFIVVVAFMHTMTQMGSMF